MDDFFKMSIEDIHQIIKTENRIEKFIRNQTQNSRRVEIE